MPLKSTFVILTTVILAIAVLVLSAIAWARVNELALPLPVFLPILNVLLPILTAIAWPIFRRLVATVKKHALPPLLPYLAYGSTLAPFALLVLSLVYASPSDLQSCAADRQWLQLFDNKDERSVHSIQTSLRCCGYNSMHDRAWPFPSKNVDARTCERTMGYTVACGDMWRSQQGLASALTAVASFLNWLITVRCLNFRHLHFADSLQVLVVANFPQTEGQVQLPAWSNHTTRLLGAGTRHVEEARHEDEGTSAQSEQSRVWNSDAEHVA